MKVVVGVTDSNWANFLRDRPHLSEANFWTPSATNFKALKSGEPFLFKTHWPENQLVGGGFFSGFTQLTIAEAWSLFGEGNGAATIDAMRAGVSRYYKTAATIHDRIGCVLLRDLFFTKSGAGIEAPSDFSKNIVRYKGYELADSAEIGQRLDLMFHSSDIRFSDTYRSTELGPTRACPAMFWGRVGRVWRGA